MSLPLEDLKIANDVSIPFFLIGAICDLTMLTLYATAPKSFGLRKYFSRIVMYLASADFIWVLGCLMQYIRFALGIAPNQSQAACDIFGPVLGFAKVFYTVWDAFIAITMYMKIVRNKSTKYYERPFCIALSIWVILLIIFSGAFFPMESLGTFCFIGGPNSVYGQEIMYFSHVYAVLLIVITAYTLTIYHICRIYFKVGQKSRVNVHKRAIIQLMLLPFVSLVIWVPSLGRTIYQINHPMSFPALIIFDITSCLSGPLNLVIWGGTRKVWRAYHKDSKPESSSDSNSSSKHANDVEFAKSNGAINSSPTSAGSDFSDVKVISVEEPKM